MFLIIICTVIFLRKKRGTLGTLTFDNFSGASRVMPEKSASLSNKSAMPMSPRMALRS